MDFGNIVAGSMPGSITLAPAGNRTSTNGASLPSNAGTISVASFKVSGEFNYSYTITLPQTVVLSRQAGNETMLVDGFQSFPSGTGTLNASGSQVLNIGATLHTDANQPTGHYTTLSPFEVVVNYN
ncbi:MAG: YapH protein [Flaviaesturariibacter sp.]|nr:YapH protein [Flaviaesturariibacter sp.]